RNQADQLELVGSSDRLVLSATMSTQTQTTRTAAINLTGPVPGPRSAALLERRKKSVLAGVATLHPIFVERASGSTVTDVDGNTYIDFAGGIGVMNAGHVNPAVT